MELEWGLFPGMHFPETRKREDDVFYHFFWVAETANFVLVKELGNLWIKFW
jgi:hypothetical protein